MKTRHYDCIIVGAGAAGLMAAICAAREGAGAAILEHSSSPAQKLLLTGSGRCNLTNIRQGDGFYHCGNPAFVSDALKKFSSADTIRFFEDLGVMTSKKGTYVYPRSMQSRTVRDALLSEAERIDIPIFCDIGIRTIKKSGRGFFFDTKEGPFRSGSCVLSCGGRSYPKTGSDGSGSIYARAFGHRVKETFPVLVPLLAKDSPLKAAAGVRCPAKVSIRYEGETLSEDTGELQITDYGISGIVVFQVSHEASELLSKGSSPRADIDLLPEISCEDACEYISRMALIPDTKKGWDDILEGLVNRNLAKIALSLSKVRKGSVYGRSKDEICREAAALVKTLKNVSMTITGTKGYAFAQATAGGVSADEILSDTMGSVIVPGLFLAGEMIDVDGLCGGYNLQWAFSSGAIAGRSAAKYVSRDKAAGKL